MENNIKKYFTVTNKYLAESLAFLKFTYFKNGFGKDCVYTFEDTIKIQNTIDTLIEMRKQL